MSNPMPRSGPDAPAKRAPLVLAVLPYGMLAFCVLLAEPISRPTGGPLFVELTLSGLAAAWMLWMFTLHPDWRERPPVMAVFITVLMVIGALLVITNTLFGLYTFTIYFYVIRYLPWPWRLLGATGVAILAGTSQAYGVKKTTAAGLLIYLVIVVVNVAIAIAYAWSRWNAEVEVDRRQRALDELSQANRRLEATLAENAGLHAQLLTQAREAGILDERQRMAREIHDTLAQGLTGIITQLQAAEHAIEDPAAWRRHLRPRPGWPATACPKPGGRCTSCAPSRWRRPG